MKLWALTHGDVSELVVPVAADGDEDVPRQEDDQADEEHRAQDQVVPVGHHLAV